MISVQLVQIFTRIQKRSNFSNWSQKMTIFSRTVMSSMIDWPMLKSQKSKLQKKKR